MATFSLRNDSASEILLADVGLPISASTALDFNTDDTFFDRLCDSDDLRTNINSQDVVVVYDSSDLSVQDGLDFFDIENKYLDEDSDLGGWINSATAPPSPSDCDAWFNTNDHILYIYDGSRSKWLSAPLMETVSKAGSVDNAYLSVNDITHSDVAGLFLPRDATLTGVEIKASGGNSNKLCYFGIDYSLVQSFYIVNHAVSLNNLDIDLDKGSIAQILVSGTGTPINDVAARIEFKWRSS